MAPSETWGASSDSHRDGIAAVILVILVIPVFLPMREHMRRLRKDQYERLARSACDD
jgi:hypothetical protein